MLEKFRIQILTCTIFTISAATINLITPIFNPDAVIYPVAKYIPAIIAHLALILNIFLKEHSLKKFFSTCVKTSLLFFAIGCIAVLTGIESGYGIPDHITAVMSAIIGSIIAYILIYLFNEKMDAKN